MKNLGSAGCGGDSEGRGLLPTPPRLPGLPRLLSAITVHEGERLGGGQGGRGKGDGLGSQHVSFFGSARFASASPCLFFIGQELAEAVAGNAALRELSLANCLVGDAGAEAARHPDAPGSLVFLRVI